MGKSKNRDNNNSNIISSPLKKKFSKESSIIEPKTEFDRLMQLYAVVWLLRDVPHNYQKQVPFLKMSTYKDAKRNKAYIDFRNKYDTFFEDNKGTWTKEDDEKADEGKSINWNSEFIQERIEHAGQRIIEKATIEPQKKGFLSKNLPKKSENNRRFNGTSLIFEDLQAINKFLDDFFPPVKEKKFTRDPSLWFTPKIRGDKIKKIEFTDEKGTKTEVNESCLRFIAQIPAFKPELESFVFPLETMADHGKFRVALFKAMNRNVRELEEIIIKKQKVKEWADQKEKEWVSRELQYSSDVAAYVQAFPPLPILGRKLQTVVFGILMSPSEEFDADYQNEIVWLKSNMSNFQIPTLVDIQIIRDRYDQIKKRIQESHVLSLKKTGQGQNKSQELDYPNLEMNLESVGHVLKQLYKEISDQYSGPEVFMLSEEFIELSKFVAWSAYGLPSTLDFQTRLFPKIFDTIREKIALVEAVSLLKADKETEHTLKNFLNLLKACVCHQEEILFSNNSLDSKKDQIIVPSSLDYSAPRVYSTSSSTPTSRENSSENKPNITNINEDNTQTSPQSFGSTQPSVSSSYATLITSPAPYVPTVEFSPAQLDTAVKSKLESLNVSGSHSQAGLTIPMQPSAQNTVVNNNNNSTSSIDSTNNDNLPPPIPTVPPPSLSAVNGNNANNTNASLNTDNSSSLPPSQSASTVEKSDLSQKVDNQPPAPEARNPPPPPPPPPPVVQGEKTSKININKSSVKGNVAPKDNTDHTAELAKSLAKRLKQINDSSLNITIQPSSDSDEPIKSEPRKELSDDDKKAISNLADSPAMEKMKKLMSEEDLTANSDDDDAQWSDTDEAINKKTDEESKAAKRADEERRKQEEENRNKTYSSFINNNPNISSNVEIKDAFVTKEEEKEETKEERKEENANVSSMSMFAQQPQAPGSVSLRDEAIAVVEAMLHFAEEKNKSNKEGTKAKSNANKAIVAMTVVVTNLHAIDESTFTVERAKNVLDEQITKRLNTHNVLKGKDGFLNNENNKALVEGFKKKVEAAESVLKPSL